MEGCVQMRWRNIIFEALKSTILCLIFFPDIIRPKLRLRDAFFHPDHNISPIKVIILIWLWIICFLDTWQTDGSRSLGDAVIYKFSNDQMAAVYHSYFAHLHDLFDVTIEFFFLSITPKWLVVPFENEKIWFRHEPSSPSLPASRSSFLAHMWAAGGRIDSRRKEREDCHFYVNVPCPAVKEGKPGKTKEGKTINSLMESKHYHKTLQILLTKEQNFG